MMEKIKGLASMTLLLLYPCVFMYFQNVGEGDFVEVFEAFIIFMVFAIIIYWVAYIILRNFLKSIFYSELAMLVLMNFNTILAAVKKLLPETRKAYWFLTTILLGIVLLVWLKKKQADVEPLITILGAVFGCLILFNFVTALPAIVSKITTEKNVSVSKEISEAVFTEKPNVYYFIYDEYGGFENLERYYNYDNADFEKYLIDEGFNISYSSRNTESIFTSTILPNLLNLEYVASDEEYSVTNFSKTESCAMYQLFANNGYTINMINHHNQLETLGCNVLNTGKRSETLSTYILENSIWLEIKDLKKWVSTNIIGEETDYAVILKEVLEVAENCANKISKHQPTLTVSYICAPHHYFALNEIGQGISSEYELDFEDKWVYLGQLKYVTKSIEKTVENIKEKDPDALIIIQSDHGMRYPKWMKEYHNTGPYDRKAEIPYMQNILNCVYYQGKTIEIDGLSGINTLRTVFNSVLGTDFKLLDSVYMD